MCVSQMRFGIHVEDGRCDVELSAESGEATTFPVHVCVWNRDGWHNSTAQAGQDRTGHHFILSLLLDNLHHRRLAGVTRNSGSFVESTRLKHRCRVRH